MSSPRRPSPFDRSFLTGVEGTGTLILVRHGQQEWPDQDTSTTGDWTNPPLSEPGHLQAKAVGEYLKTETVHAVYASPLSRALNTGQAIAAHHNIEVEVIEDLAEIQLYRDLPDDARVSEFLSEKVQQGVWERFAQTRRWDAYPFTESSIDFRRRAGFAVEATIVTHPGETVVVACHSGVINAYLAEILRLDYDMVVRAAHASVHRIKFGDGRRVLDTINENHYLAAADLLTH